MAFWGELISGIVGAGVSLIGNQRAAGRVADANEAAAAAAAIENQKARDAYAAAAGRGIDAIRAGTAGYEEEIRPLMRVNAQGLTDSQMMALEDIRRDADATLAASGLRGAGRAGVAAHNDTTRRATLDMYDTNTDRLTGLKTGLAGIRADEGRAIANTEVGAGTQIGGTFQDQGRTSANALVGAGEARAGADVANAGVINHTFGSIGAAIADSLKREALNTRSRPRTGTV